MVETPDWISSLGEDDAKVVASDLHFVMSAVAERIHYAESRRNNFAVIAAGLFAGAIALASMAVQASFSRGSWALAVLAAGFFLLSLFLFYVYSMQVNRYPWTSATNTWKWFYRDALPKQDGFDHTFTRWLFRWPSEVKRARKEFSSQLTGFGNRIAGVADPRASLWQDVQQLYVLHVNEKYKNAYLTYLRKVLSAGLIVVLVLAGFAFAAQGLNDSEASSRVHPQKEVKALMSWLPFEGGACSKNCWMLKVAARNQSGKDAYIRIRGLGTQCLQLPNLPEVSPKLVRARGAWSGVAYVVCGPGGPAVLAIEVSRNGRPI